MYGRCFGGWLGLGDIFVWLCDLEVVFVVVGGCKRWGVDKVVEGIWDEKRYCEEGMVVLLM